MIIKDIGLGQYLFYLAVINANILKNVSVWYSRCICVRIMEAINEETHFRFICITNTI